MNKFYQKFNFKTSLFVALLVVTGAFGFGTGFLATPNIAHACGTGYSQSTGSGCVSYSAHLTITVNNVTGTGGDYTVGDAWTLKLTSNIPNTSFSMCGTHIPGVAIVTCTPNWGTTDADGNWTSSSNFKTEDIGIWNEYIKFTDEHNSAKNVSTNVLSFTVSKPAPVSLVNVNIVANKIICNSESDLPNWGLGGPDIIANTASQFLASHSNCHPAPDWKFQWASSTASDPGISFVGEASGWNTFGPTNAQGAATVSVPVLSANTPYLWVREVLKDNYLPFTYQNNDNSNSQSAEMYCGSDVLNYDNYDKVDGPFTSNGVYYCVAFNVKTGPVNPPPVNTPPTITLNGDNPLNLTVNIPFIDPGATATDKEDGDLTSKIVKGGTVDASTTGSYILTYSVTDSGGLSASTTRTVIVNPVVCTSNCGGGGANADIAVTKTADKNTPNVGDTITYNVGVVNHGPDIATAVTVTDSLPSGLNFVSATSSIGNYVSTSGTWTIGDLANASSATLTIVATVASSTEGQTITNTAVVASTQNDSDLANNTSGASITVNTPNTNPPGGGGGSSTGSGGGRKGGHRHSIAASSGEVLGATSCYYLRDFLKIDWQNDPIEVLKLQSFLNVYEKENLQLTAKYDQATFDAVSRFQTKYASDILAPWGSRVTKGFTYILTRKKVNEIYCNTPFPVTPNQQAEIVSFRLGNNPPDRNAAGQIVSYPHSYFNQSTSSMLSDSQNTKGTASSSLAASLGFSSSTVSVVRNVAISLFSLPQKIFSRGGSLLVFLILIALAFVAARLWIGSSNNQVTRVVPVIPLAKTNKKNTTPDKKESPVIELPGVLPDEEIIIENPEEGPEDVIATPDLRDK